MKQLYDKEGRYIIINLEVGELTLTICNIYAPNKGDPVFFQNVSEQLTLFKCEEIILAEIFTLFWMSLPGSSQLNTFPKPGIPSDSSRRAVTSLVFASIVDGKEHRDIFDVNWCVCALEGENVEISSDVSRLLSLHQ